MAVGRNIYAEIEKLLAQLEDKYDLTPKGEVLGRIGAFGQDASFAVGRILTFMIDNDEYVWDTLITLVNLGEKEGLSTLLHLIYDDLDEPLHNNPSALIEITEYEPNKPIKLDASESGRIRQQAADIVMVFGPGLISELGLRLRTGGYVQLHDIRKFVRLFSFIGEAFVNRITWLRRHAHEDPVKYGDELQEIRTQVAQTVEDLDAIIGSDLDVQPNRPHIEQSQENFHNAVQEAAKEYREILSTLVVHAFKAWQRDSEDMLFD